MLEKRGVCVCVYLYITGMRTHSQMRSPHDIKPVVLPHARSQHTSKGEKLKVEGFTGKHAKDPRPWWVINILEALPYLLKCTQRLCS